MVLPFDELNVLETKYNMPFLEGIDKDTVAEDIYDLLIACFIYGTTNVNEQLNEALELDALRGEKIIFKKVGGKSWLDRLNDYFDNAFADEYGEYYVMISGQRTALSDAVVRIAETETVRVFNETMLDLATDVAKKGARILKRWNTMEDERVRLTHSVLQGTEVEASDVFRTIDGDSAKAPGLFSDAGNNVNCRCWLTFRKA